MTRKDFVLNLPFREITPSDAEQPFANELQPINHIDLSYLVNLNIENRHIFVYELDGKVLAFMTFLNREDHFHLDLVEVNRLHDESKCVKPGFMLITLLENLSRGSGHSRITLHSIQDRIHYYQNLGYQVTGNPIPNPDYGPLTPMEKAL
ncbi:GNAT family N-acetyltransferase [Nitrosopumilus sp.]|uniref:GNAT family N-acetyltransferase n=1 Tax=Nitrosopumilus sp. TaxID=2024843 RepID=UPI0034A06FDE